MVNYLFRVFILFLLGLSLFVGCSPVGFDVDEAEVCSGVQNCNPITPHLFEASANYTVPSPKVDILIVNDNSGSMIPEQQRMANAFNNFVSRLSGLDWQLGITTMDVSEGYREAHGDPYISVHPQANNTNYQDGKLLRFYNGSYILRESDANRAALFADAITIDQLGSHDERGILTAGLALQQETGRLIRNNSTHVAIIMLTDEDVRGKGMENNSDPSRAYLYGITPRDTKARLEQIWKQVSDVNGDGQPDKTISVHSIIVKDEACRAQQNTQTHGMTDAYVGSMYADLSNDPKFQGIVGNICASSYTNELTNMGNYIKGRTTKDVPVPSCDVIQNDPQYPITLTINGQSHVLANGRIPGFTSVKLFPGRIEFTPALNAGTNVQASFYCNSN